jgi:hypothetical protein
MKTLLALLVALVFEAVTTRLFFLRITVGSQGDGDLGLGLLFWVMVAAYALVDLVLVGVLLWEAFR